MGEVTINDFRAAIKCGRDGDVVLQADTQNQGVLNGLKVVQMSRDEQGNMRTRRALYEALKQDSLSGTAFLNDLGKSLIGENVINAPLKCRDIESIIKAHEAKNNSVMQFTAMVGQRYYAKNDKDGFAGIVSQAAHASTAVISTKGFRELINAAKVSPGADIEGLCLKANEVNKKLSSAYELTGGELFKVDAEGKSVINEAINALSDLEAMLREGVNKETLKLTPGLSLLMDYCAARASEMITVCCEAKAMEANGQALSNETLRELVSEKAKVMHGNAAYVQNLTANSQEVEKLEGKLKALKNAANVSGPASLVSSDDIRTLRSQFVALRERLQTEQQSAAEKSLSVSIIARVNRDIRDLERIFSVDFTKQVEGIVNTFIVHDPKLVPLHPTQTDNLENTLTEIREGIVKAFSDPNLDAASVLGENLAKLNGLACLNYFPKNKYEILTELLQKGILNRVDESRKDGFRVSHAILQRLLNGEIGLGSAIVAYVHGFRAEDVDPTLSDRFVASVEPLGSGAFNQVYKVKYEMPDGSNKTVVFKPELNAIAGLNSTLIGQSGYDKGNRVGEINVATRLAAEVLGCPNNAVRVKIGALNGQIGFFMEVADGTEADQAAQGNAPFAMETLRRLPVQQRIRRVGTLARELCKLEWQDLLTGQVDRHSRNYFVGVDKDDNAIVKGVDNDLSFMNYRVGPRRFVLDAFRQQAILQKYGKPFYQFVFDMNNLSGFNTPAVTQEGDKWVIDLDRLVWRDPFWAWNFAREIFGVNSMALPTRIPASVAKFLDDVGKKGNYMEAARELMKNGKFSEEQIQATASRIKGMVTYLALLRQTAEWRQNPHVVMEDNDWLQKENIDSIIAEQFEAHGSNNPTTPMDEYLYRDFLHLRFRDPNEWLRFLEKDVTDDTHGVERFGV